jgi:ankyrin repeat protein
MITQQPANKDLLDAVQHQNLHLVPELIRHGADVNAASQNGWTPLMLAILHDSRSLAKLLLDNGADPNLTTASEENPCRSPLAVAISNGRVEMVKLLMTHDVDTQSISGGEQTALTLARKLALRPPLHAFYGENMADIIKLLEHSETK